VRIHPAAVPRRAKVPGQSSLSAFFARHHVHRVYAGLSVLCRAGEDGESEREQAGAGRVRGARGI
jgi:hypothetical protein